MSVYTQFDLERLQRLTGLHVVSHAGRYRIFEKANQDFHAGYLAQLDGLRTACIWLEGYHQCQELALYKDNNRLSAELRKI